MEPQIRTISKMPQGAKSSSKEKQLETFTKNYFMKKNYSSFPRAIMKAMLPIFILLISSSFFKSYAQVTVSGKKTDWTLVGSVPANTSFQIKGSGTVNFGCQLGACKDGVNAGVTGNAYVKWFRDNWGSIGSILKDIGEGAGIAASLFSEEVTIKPGETIASYIKRKSKSSQLNEDVFFQNYISKVSSEVHYDEGGFWIVMTVNNQTPQIGQNTFCEPALYYWYNRYFIQLYKEKVSPTIEFTQPVWIWVLPHDGGKDAVNFNKKDYHDNSGSYKVWIVQ